MSPARANQTIYKLLRDGFRAPVRRRNSKDEEESIETVTLIDWNNPANNDFLLASQFWIAGDYGRNAPTSSASSTAFPSSSSNSKPPTANSNSPSKRTETFWLTQRRMAELFGVEVNTVNYHVREVFASNELETEGTIRKVRIVQTEGQRQVSREVDFYSLDMVIAVGYRVNSFEATRFRIWATKTLKEFIVKGFILDDERLKQGKNFGTDYFEELLPRIREIRASERRFYLKITDLYEQCSIDYRKDAEITATFFKTVQNKLRWAITGQTAAQIVAGRANANKPNMA